MLNGQAAGENGRRTFAQYGLSQSLPLGGGVAIDLTLDASDTLRGAIDPGARITPFQSLGTAPVGNAADAGLGDHAAGTVGVSYRDAIWSANGRVEYRAADEGDRWGVTANAVRALGEGRTLAAAVRAYRFAGTGPGERGAPGRDVARSISADLAIAWRPPTSRWAVLERLTLRDERAGATVDTGLLADFAGIGTPDRRSTRAINNLALSYRQGEEASGHMLEATLYHGAKLVRARGQDGLEPSKHGFIQLLGFDLRRDVGRRFDVGVQGSVQHDWSRGAAAWSVGPSVGMAPAGDLWVSVGYNVAGFHDRDFSEARYTRAGPYLTLRAKFGRELIPGLGR